MSLQVAQVVINETEEPIFASWNGVTYIWDPKPKAGKPAKCFVVKVVPGKVERGSFFKGDKEVKLRDGNGIKTGEQLVEATPAEKSVPTWRHVCDPDFVHAMRNTNIYDEKSPVKSLTFADAIHDKYDQAVVERSIQLSQQDAELAEGEKKKAKLAAEITMLIEKKKVLETK